jgi:2-polyprenyl-3-methyl-5-hydroxy-6-metoxy-1,4-benzoquinol methylase
MNIKVSGGVKENGIVVGNTYDKYGSKNFIVKWLMSNFEKKLSSLVVQVSPSSINEIGCGEGYWVIKWNKQGISARGTDFSHQAIELAKKNAEFCNMSASIFRQKNIYDVEHNEDEADLIVCCEVLEHLENPDKALESLQKISSNFLIISVPREPIWCILNLLRGKYVLSLGNTPGHIQHWSKAGIVSLVSNYFEVIKVESPFPWTMLLCKPIKK